MTNPRSPRIAISGIDAGVSGSAVTSLALLLHEFATNATKYGALSADTGTVKVVFAEEGDAIVVHWIERGGPPVSPPTGAEGFGGVLSRIAVSNQLGGEIVREWRPEGLAIRLSVPRSRLDLAGDAGASAGNEEASAGPDSSAGAMINRAAYPKPWF